MSSAGLRVLLIGHKTAASKRGKFSIRNVTATVRDTLEVTGFADALHIEE